MNERNETVDLTKHGPVALYPLAFLLTASGVLAHDPFDCSARMTVRADQIEIVVTMGLDGARQILAASGLAPAEVAETVRARGPHATLALQTALASSFFEIKNGEEQLPAKSASELSEGMEVIFTLTYPRPARGVLMVRANYYDHIPSLRNGSFVACDENANQLGAALLSRAAVFARVQLPEIKGTDQSSTPVSPAVAGQSEPALPPAVAPPSAIRPSFGELFKLGVEHILTGFDHLLFLAALLIGVRKPVSMLGVITCFTLAHSVTLALAVLNLVAISPRIIEPLIAVSIIVVCVENFLRKDFSADRFWLAGGFGLIHGFGFAAALRETDLARAGASIATPLLSFNLGVEAGQLAVALVFLPVLFWLRQWQGFARRGTFAVSAAVIVVSGYWLLERTVFYR